MTSCYMNSFDEEKRFRNAMNKRKRSDDARVPDDPEYLKYLEQKQNT